MQSLLLCSPSTYWLPERGRLGCMMRRSPSTISCFFLNALLNFSKRATTAGNPSVVTYNRALSANSFTDIKPLLSAHGITYTFEGVLGGSWHRDCSGEDSAVRASEFVNGSVRTAVTVVCENGRAFFGDRHSRSFVPDVLAV